jgi:hypothetical protein
MRQLVKRAWAEGYPPYTPCKPNQGIVYEVLKTAFMLRDYGLFNNVIAWAGTEGVGNNSFSLVHAATVENLLDFGEVKQRSVLSFHHLSLR